MKQELLESKKNSRIRLLIFCAVTRCGNHLSIYLYEPSNFRSNEIEGESGKRWAMSLVRNLLDNRTSFFPRFGIRSQSSLGFENSFSKVYEAIKFENDRISEIDLLKNLFESVFPGFASNKIWNLMQFICFIEPENECTAFTVFFFFFLAALGYLIFGVFIHCHSFLFFQIFYLNRYFTHKCTFTAILLVSRDLKLSLEIFYTGFCEQFQF